MLAWWAPIPMASGSPTPNEGAAVKAAASWALERADQALAYTETDQEKVAREAWDALRDIRVILKDHV